LSDILLHVAIGRFIGIISPGKIFAGVDTTGFEDRHRTHTTRIAVHSGTRTPR